MFPRSDWQHQETARQAADSTPGFKPLSVSFPMALQTAVLSSAAFGVAVVFFIRHADGVFSGSREWLGTVLLAVVFRAKGTEQVWVVYPGQKEIHQYLQGEKGVRVYSGDDFLRADSLVPGLTLRTEDLLSLPDMD